MFKSYMQTIRTIEYPPIPLVHELEASGGLTLDSELVLYGKPCNGPKKGFIIEFLGQSGDVILHFNPRFKFFEHTVVCNTADAMGKWQKEERHTSPFRLDQDFKLRIINLVDQYKLFANDKEFCTFRHRVPASHITKVKVDGDVQVTKYQLIVTTIPPTNPSVNHPPPYQPYPVSDNSNTGSTYGWPPAPNMPAPYPQQPPSNPSLGGGAQAYPSYPSYPSLSDTNPTPNSY